MYDNRTTLKRCYWTWLGASVVRLSPGRGGGSSCLPHNGTATGADELLSWTTHQTGIKDGTGPLRCHERPTAGHRLTLTGSMPADRLTAPNPL
jgi:hypothetical protein